MYCYQPFNVVCGAWSVVRDFLWLKYCINTVSLQLSMRKLGNHSVTTNIAIVKKPRTSASTGVIDLNEYG